MLLNNKKTPLTLIIIFIIICLSKNQERVTVLDKQHKILKKIEKQRKKLHEFNPLKNKNKKILKESKKLDKYLNEYNKKN